MSPKKLNVVAQLVRGLSVDEALAQCALLPKRAARVTERVLSSARANAAHNHGLEVGRLRVARAFVGKGTYLRRIRWHARGKSGVMHHPKAHLTVILEEQPAGAAGRLSRRNALVAPAEGAPPAAWQRHREKRLARAKRAARAAGAGAAGGAAPAAQARQAA
jgi:ribosomal protein L22